MLRADGGTGYVSPATSGGQIGQDVGYAKPPVGGLVTGAHVPVPPAPTLTFPGSGSPFQRHIHEMASTNAYSPETLANMVRMRLRSKPESYFEHWHFHKTLRKGDELVIGLIVQDGVVTVLEDAWALFPSDQLITQLRLLEK